MSRGSPRGLLFFGHLKKITVTGVTVTVSLPASATGNMTVTKWQVVGGSLTLRLVHRTYHVTFTVTQWCMSNKPIPEAWSLKPEAWILKPEAYAKLNNTHKHLLYIYIYIYIYIHTYTYIHRYHVYIYIHIYIHSITYMNIYTHIWSHDTWPTNQRYGYIIIF